MVSLYEGGHKLPRLCLQLCGAARSRGECAIEASAHEEVLHEEQRGLVAALGCRLGGAESMGVSPNTVADDAHQILLLYI